MIIFQPPFLLCRQRVNLSDTKGESGKALIAIKSRDVEYLSLPTKVDIPMVLYEENPLNGFLLGESRENLIVYRISQYRVLDTK